MLYMYTIIALTIVFGLNKSYASPPPITASTDPQESEANVHAIEESRADTDNQGNFAEQHDTTNVRLGPKTWVPLPAKPAKLGDTTWVNVPLSTEQVDAGEHKLPWPSVSRRKKPTTIERTEWSHSTPLIDTVEANYVVVELSNDVVSPPKRSRKGRLSPSHEASCINVATHTEQVEFDQTQSQLATRRRKEKLTIRSDAVEDNNNKEVEFFLRRPRLRYRRLKPRSLTHKTRRYNNANKYHLWQFIYDKLSSPGSENVVRWADKEQTMFCILNREQLAEEWGPFSRSKNPMTKSTMFKSLNYYLDNGALLSTRDENLFRFANIPATVVNYIASTQGTTPVPIVAASGE